MGQEAPCTVRFRGGVSQGKALLETDELVFRGDHGLRLKLPFKKMRSVEARKGELRVESPDETVVFELGARAEKWAQKILHPPALLHKLGVKAGMRVLVVEVEDEDFLAGLRDRTDGVVLGEGSSSARSLRLRSGQAFDTSGRAERDGSPVGNDAGYDAVFVGVDGPADLKQFASLKQAIKPNGAVWAVFRKGRKDFNENDVLRGGVAVGLVDVKVARFSDTHTASKFVIRKAERGVADR